MKFTAIDVETANPNMASICQIGIVKVQNGLISEEWKTYIDPEDYFDGINVSIHGIEETLVKGAPTFSQICDTLRSHLEAQVLVSHTHFDRVALHQASSRSGFDITPSAWLDSARVARRAWKSCAHRGYGLHDVCSMLGFSFKHHDALEDARAAAHIVLAACTECSLDIDAWLRRVREPIDPSSGNSGAALRRDGNPEGPLYGEVIVFTGALDIPRREAADLAAALGCKVASGVTTETTLLVVGDQDIAKLAGHDKSSKHRKAEKLISSGVPMRILGETDFKRLAALSGKSP